MKVRIVYVKGNEQSEVQAQQSLNLGLIINGMPNYGKALHLRH